MRDPRLLIMGLATFALSSFYWLRIFGQPLFISLMFNWISGFLVGTWLVFRLWENSEAKVVGDKPE